MKRFTQEDPLGFVDGPNAYAYVGGVPIDRVDPLGLSADDVERIKNDIDKTIDQLTREKRRRGGGGTLNGFLNNWERVFKENMTDCWDQVMEVNDHLTKVHTDDRWKFEVVDHIGHATGRATSSDPHDPIIDYDPWRHEIEVSHYW
jgi:hypothetical protein